jgi:hypothetical protein
MGQLQIWNPQASFTRPNNTTAYALGQIVANAVTAAAVLPMSFAIAGNSMPGATRITRVRLAKSGTSATNAAFRVHLYATSPTPANGDGGVWQTDQSANYLGSIDVPSMKAFTDGCCDVGAAPAGSEFLLRLPAGKTIYSLLEARAAYAPAANEAFTLTLETVDDL